MTFQVITKLSGGSARFGMSSLKGVATDWTTYHAGRSDGTTELYGYPNITFNASSTVGNQSRFTYDLLNTPNEVVGEKRTSNSGTFTGTTETTEHHGLLSHHLQLEWFMVLKGGEMQCNNWTVRMWTEVTPDKKVEVVVIHQLQIQ